MADSVSRVTGHSSLIHRHQPHQLPELPEAVDCNIDVAVGASVNIANAAEVLEQHFLFHHAFTVDFQATEFLSAQRADQHVIAPVRKFFSSIKLNGSG